MSVAIDLSGKTALITGASRGIGARLARTFHAAGATVWLHHPDIGPTRPDSDKIAAELNATRPASAFVVAADVSDANAVQRMLGEIRARSGGLDSLINNAAILRDRTLGKMSLEEWRSVVDVNLTGVFHCCKFGLRILRDGGAIVSLGSISALVGFFGQANYAAAKGGVTAMMRVLSRECAKRNIRVNAIAPGGIETPMAATIPETARAEMLKQIALGRFGKPEEIANVASFLWSPLASYFTGQTIEVNEGWRGRKRNASGLIPRDPGLGPRSRFGAGVSTFEDEQETE